MAEPKRCGFCNRFIDQGLLCDECARNDETTIEIIQINERGATPSGAFRYDNKT